MHERNPFFEDESRFTRTRTTTTGSAPKKEPLFHTSAGSYVPKDTYEQATRHRFLSSSDDQLQERMECIKIRKYFLRTYLGVLEAAPAGYVDAPLFVPPVRLLPGQMIDM